MKSLLNQAAKNFKEQLDESNARLKGYCDFLFFSYDGEDLSLEAVNYDPVTTIHSEYLEVVCEELHALQDALGQFKYRRAQHHGDH